MVDVVLLYLNDQLNNCLITGPISPQPSCKSHLKPNSSSTLPWNFAWISMNFKIPTGGIIQVYRNSKNYISVNQKNITNFSSCWILEAEQKKNIFFLCMDVSLGKKITSCGPISRIFRKTGPTTKPHLAEARWSWPDRLDATHHSPSPPKKGGVDVF